MGGDDKKASTAICVAQNNIPRIGVSLKFRAFRQSRT